MSWFGCLLKDSELFILFAENSQILLKIYIIPIFSTFTYLVALNLLVVNSTHLPTRLIIAADNWLKWDNLKIVSFLCFDQPKSRQIATPCLSPIIIKVVEGIQWFYSVVFFIQACKRITDCINGVVDHLGPVLPTCKSVNKMSAQKWVNAFDIKITSRPTIGRPRSKITHNGFIIIFCTAWQNCKGCKYCKYYCSCA